MDGFGSDFSSGAGSGKMDTGTIMEQVKVQIAVANAQELLQRMTDKCFKKCIGKPGGTLDNSEQVTVMPVYFICRLMGWYMKCNFKPQIRCTFEHANVMLWDWVMLTDIFVCLLQKCIAMCMDRYMDAWNTVSRAYNSRLQRERARI
uniref:Mitochondrial import inner membrane translocase subunit n=2 Tax=Oncorhynchus TaxID=8016 RepID=A0A8C7G287_ONCKI